MTRILAITALIALGCNSRLPEYKQSPCKAVEEWNHNSPVPDSLYFPCLDDEERVLQAWREGRTK